MSKDFIPGADAAFNAWQYQLADALIGHAAAWGIPAAAVTQLQNQRANWDGAYSWVTNPATRTKARILAKNEARKEYEKFLRGILKQYVTYNPAVSDEDRVNMQLPVHDTKPTPVPPPTAQATAEITLPGIHLVELHIEKIPMPDQDHEASDYGIRIYYGIMPQGGASVEAAVGIRRELMKIPQAGVELPHSVFTRKKTYRFDFPGTDRGKQVFFCLRYENSKGESGPWGPLFDAIIP
jgi:hypothetical protein